MNIRRAAGMAAVLGALVAAQPASAQVQVTTWETSESVSDGAGNTLTETANAELLTNSGTTMAIAVNCTARSLPNGRATTVEQCFLLGANNEEYHLEAGNGTPGPVASESGVYIDVPTQPYRVCVKALTFVGVDLLQAPLSCSPQV